MERLNERYDDEYLRQLKEFEEFIGIDVVTLYKARKNGIYRKMGNEIIFCKQDEFFVDVIHGLIQFNRYKYDNLWGSDYGKTWALTKEELE